MLYLKYLLMQIKCQLQHRASFVMMVTGRFIMSFTGILSIYFLLDRFHSVGGFSVYEIMLCFSVVYIGSSFAECFVRGFDLFPTIISNGEFDRIMVRPRNEIIQVLGSRTEISRIGVILQAALTLAFAVKRSGIDWTFSRVFLMIMMILSCCAVFCGLYIVYAALCFFTVEGLEFMNIFLYGGRDFGAYPLSVFGDKILKFFTFVIPMALVQYYPFLYLTGRSGNFIHFIAPFGAFLFLIPCLILWKIGVAHYKSVGS